MKGKIAWVRKPAVNAGKYIEPEIRFDEPDDYGDIDWQPWEKFVLITVEED